MGRLLIFAGIAGLLLLITELAGSVVRSFSQKLDAVLREVRLMSPADLGHHRLDVRLFVIRSQLAQAPRPIVFIGDSITEAALLPSTICGHLVVNAGIGGASVENYVALAGKVLNNTNVALVVIALGTNDSSGKPTAEFGDRYMDLVVSLRPHAGRLVLAGIPPLSNGPLRDYFNPDTIKKNTDTIRTTAQMMNLPFVEFAASLAAEGNTIDGVHLNAGGYKIWRSEMLPLIAKELGCSLQSIEGEP
jgi:lysophospholipase L1-like esterase